jgi:hypothetical protein
MAKILHRLCMACQEGQEKAAARDLAKSSARPRRELRANVEREFNGFCGLFSLARRRQLGWSSWQRCGMDGVVPCWGFRMPMVRSTIGCAWSRAASFCSEPLTTAALSRRLQLQLAWVDDTRCSVYGLSRRRLRPSETCGHGHKTRKGHVGVRPSRHCLVGRCRRGCREETAGGPRF